MADTVQRSVLSIYGLRGLSDIEPTLIEFDEETNTGIIRCNHSHLRQMRTALAFITDIGDDSAAIHVGKVSGTIKSLRENTERTDDG